MARWGDSRHPTAATWVFSTESRPLVGTSRTYQGREVEAANDSKIGWSPGPKYYPQRSRYVDSVGPAHPLGGPGVQLDKRVSPGPAGIPGVTQAPAIGFQRIDGRFESAARWGMGSSTRDQREDTHLAPYFTANLSSRTLLGGAFSAAHDAAHAATAAQASRPAASAAAAPSSTASRTQLSRALAVALAADEAQSDPALSAALGTLRSRVKTLHAQRPDGS